MPNSTTTSGGNGSVSASSVQKGLDASLDIEQLKVDVTAIKNTLNGLNVNQGMVDIKAAINAIVFPLATRIPALRPAIIGAANVAIATPQISAPGAGKKLVIQIMGWYDKLPTGGLLTITGTDGLIYTSVPITAAGAGFMQKAALPQNIGATIALTAGGTGVIGSLNYAVSIEEGI